MFKLKILAVKANVFKRDGEPDREYNTLTVLLPDGDTAKVNTGAKASVGQSAVLTLVVDRKTGGLTVRCTEVVA